MPTIGSDFNCAPTVVSKIQIDPTVMLPDPEVNGPPRGVKLCPCFKQINGRADRSSAWGVTCGFVIFPPQPGTKTATTNWPCFSVPIDHEIRKRGAIGGVKQVRAECEVGEHIGCRYAGALSTPPSAFTAASIPAAPRLGGSEVRFRREFLHSLRATLTGSMPASFHHARSSLTR